MAARLPSQRVWLAGGIMAAVLIVLVGWFGVIEPELSTASATRDDASSAQLQNIALETRNSTLKAQNDDAAALRASLAAALAELPSDGGLPEFTRQLSAQATATSVALSSVIVGTAAPVTTTEADPGTTDTGGTSGTQTPTSSTASGALVEIAITITATGLGADLQAFVREIQVTGPRRALVTGSGLSPSADNPAGIDGPCTLTLSLNIFSAPLSPADQAALEKLLSGT